ncbi:PREDICTED: keratin, type I cytoskeletal 9-like, partial [Priapulus caudatus]|uniref:Keratin, type I cytoskeletal 9-like n=1 Tax=Priapulus caudatus TaxID=37621 RepID=A0ABM1F4X1_PRICU
MRTVILLACVASVFCSRNDAYGAARRPVGGVSYEASQTYSRRPSTRRVVVAYAAPTHVRYASANDRAVGDGYGKTESGYGGSRYGSGTSGYGLGSNSRRSGIGLRAYGLGGNSYGSGSSGNSHNSFSYGSVPIGNARGSSSSYGSGSSGYGLGRSSSYGSQQLRIRTGNARGSSSSYGSGSSGYGLGRSSSYGSGKSGYGRGSSSSYGSGLSGYGLGRSSSYGSVPIDNARGSSSSYGSGSSGYGRGSSSSYGSGSSGLPDASFLRGWGRLDDVQFDDTGFGHEYVDVASFSYDAARDAAAAGAPRGSAPPSVQAVVGERYRSGYAHQTDSSHALRTGSGVGEAGVQLEASRSAQQVAREQFAQDASGEGATRQAGAYAFRRGDSGGIMYEPVNTQTVK